MKLIMENWNNFVNEEEIPSKRLMIDRSFLRKFAFEIPRRSDEKQITDYAIRVAAGSSFRNEPNPLKAKREYYESEGVPFKVTPLYGLNNDNFSIAIPSGDSFEIYVSYADNREKRSETDLKPSAFTSLLRKELESMGFKDGGLPSPQSDANMQQYR
jgi:hypothetical protein